MEEERKPDRSKREDDAEQRSKLRRPKDEVKDLEAPEDAGEDIRGGGKYSNVEIKR